MSLILFSIYLFLAIFNAGNMITLQIQHYGIYSFVGRNDFKNYMQANNKAAVLPSIIPALLLLLCTILLIFTRPLFMTLNAVIFSLILNVTALISTFTLQRKLQGEMASEGYNMEKINLLVNTNWIRTIVFFIQAILATVLVIKAVK
ncbi:MAG TPA: hypothetical protein VGO09_07950 [Flavisolibacter sp.]|nr:hypothetical protein [Flavisolibacter sp.]